MASAQPIFDHEKLDVYRVAVEYFARMNRAARELSGVERLTRDQWVRAAQSVPLNIAEGNGKRSPKERARFFEIARGSALECAAIQDLLVIAEAIDESNHVEGKVELKRIVEMLTRLIQKSESVREEPDEYDPTIDSTVDRQEL